MNTVKTLLGRTLGDFRILSQLGSGGGGDVYLAEQGNLGREAVLKVMASKASNTQGVAGRFLREARLASQLDHPFAAHIYDFGEETDGTMWIAMELVRGTSLRDLVEQSGPVSLARFVPFFERLCEVMQAAHEQGIIHRDIKPHNVMVLNRAARMFPKLLDLGIARRQGQPIDVSEAPSRIADSDSVELTHDGEVVGTPHYMAPEQWLDPAAADARSDLYSLTLLAYHALGGHKPYEDCDNIFSLARAHMKQPLPRLPDSLPDALNAVLAKGAAKAAADRYQSATELGLALRAASGLWVEQETLPQLDKLLRDVMLADAPQPIAEAVALLGSARSPRQAVDAVSTLRKVLVRYLAIVALAARGRVGAGGPRDSDTVLALLGQLAVDALSDTQWLSLAHELCKPFAHRRGAHPIPEIVAFFFSEPAGDDVMDAFAALTVDAATEPSAALPNVVKTLGGILQKASFLLDYALVTQSSERWMGTRRTRRALEPLSATMAESPFLVDRVGLPILSLAPLLLAAQPSGGMADELFFLDGVGRHGARMVALPAPFEHHSEDVWPWFARAIVDLARKQDEASRAEKPPYKGLSTFTSEDADNYYGREREAEAFANRLRHSRFLAVVGPSGSGKSSFVLAGVLPLLPADCRAVVMRPGSDPLARLTAKRDALRDDDLLVVDQFEELVTLCADPKERVAFAQALIDLSEEARVVVTLRDDFLIRIQQLEPLRDRLSSSLQLLATPAEDDLIRILTAPAQRVGYGFDDANLPRKMVQAVLDYPGALALLSFTASQLWELRDRELRQLRSKTYEALGGVGGALAHHAEATLAAMTAEEQALVREAFRHLVTASGTRAVLSRREMLELLGRPGPAQSVIDKLVEARLLVAFEGAQRDDRVEIIHEALIVSWPRLTQWLREDVETARFRDTLRASARQWEERARPAGLLWRTDTLAEYKVWRGRYKGRLTASEEAFASASLRDEARGRRVRSALAIVAFAVLSVALVLIFRAYREATNRFLALRQEQGRLALLDDKPLEALAYIDDAVRRGADNADLRLQSGIVDYLLRGYEGLLYRHAAPVWSMALAPDGVTLASFSDDRTVVLAGTRIATGVPCFAGDFTPDGKLLVVSCDGGKLLTIDVASKQIQSTWKVDAHRAHSVAVTSRHTAFIGRGKGVFEVDLLSGTSTRLDLPAKTQCCGVQSSPGGDTVAIFGGPFTDNKDMHGVTFVDSHDARTLADLPTVVRIAAFSPNGERVAAGTIDGDVALWDMPTKKWLWIRNPYRQPIRSVTFSRDGQLVFSTSADYLTAWKADGEVLWTVLAREPMVQMAVTLDGQRLAASGVDPTVRVFDAQTGIQLWRHFGNTGQVVQLEALPDGRIVSASGDGDITAWDSTVAHTHAVPHDGEVRDAQFTSSGLIITTTTGVTRATTDGASQQLLHERFDTQDELAVAYSPDAHIVIRGAALEEYDNQSNAVIARGNVPTSFGVIYAYRGVIALRHQGDGAITLENTDGSQAQTLKSEDEGIAAGAFVGQRRFVTCGTAGTLKLWDTASGALIQSQPAHKTFCTLSVHDGVVASLGTDATVGYWRFTGDALVEQRRTTLPAHALAVTFDPPISYLRNTGEWTQFSSDGLPLSRIPLSNLPPFDARGQGDGFWLIYRGNDFRSFQIPKPIAVERMLSLQRERGLYDLASGHLEPKSEVSVEP